MPKRYGILFWTSVVFFACHFPALAQEQLFKIGGGAGFSFPSDPELELDRGYDIGGFFGIRFNDNLSLETGFSFARFERRSARESLPEEEPETPPTSITTQATRYHLDAVLLYNLGRRQPFHPFFFGGAGIFREDQKITTAIFEEESTEPTDVQTTATSEYYPVVSFGAGFEFYILYNVAARGEWRWWMTNETKRRTHRLFFAATYFF